MLGYGEASSSFAPVLTLCFPTEAELSGAVDMCRHPTQVPAQAACVIGGIRARVRYPFTLPSHPLLRALLASALLAAVATLAGCGGAAVGPARHMQPLSQRPLAELKAKSMEKESPILMRIFKEEAELEVWKEDDSGQIGRASCRERGR